MVSSQPPAAFLTPETSSVFFLVILTILIILLFQYYCYYYLLLLLSLISSIIVKNIRFYCHSDERYHEIDYHYCCNANCEHCYFYDYARRLPGCQAVHLLSPKPSSFAERESRNPPKRSRFRIMVVSMLFASIALVRALTSEEEQPSMRRELSDEDFQLEGEEIFVEGEETCAVCLEKFNGDGALKLRCSHCFHRGCILDWCRHNASQGGTCSSAMSALSTVPPDDPRQRQGVRQEGSVEEPAALFSFHRSSLWGIMLSCSAFRIVS